MAFGVLLAAVFVYRWRGGWLLLLDWAPGPRSVHRRAPGLPSGPAISVLADLAGRVSPNAAGWGVVSGGVLAAYGGGVRLGRCWRGADGARLSWLAATVAGCVAATNPFIAARVYSGQVGVLWGYAVMWWFVAQLVDTFDRPDARSSVLPALWCALAAASTLHMLIACMLIAATFAAVQSRRIGWPSALRRLGAFGVISTGLTVAWLAPELARSGRYLGSAGGEAGVRVFSSDAAVWKLWLVAAGGGGFWRALPPGTLVAMGTVVAAAWAATLLLARHHGAGWSRDLRFLLLGCVLAAVLSAYLGRGVTFGPWSWLIASFAPAGLLREPGKLTMLALLAPACGAAAATQRVIDGRWARKRGRGPMLRGAIVLVTLVATLGSWWSLTARLTPSTYPQAWETAREAIESDGCRIAVLGDGAYTDPGFTDARIVAHPARGFFGERAVVSADSRVAGLEPRPARSPAEAWLAQVNGGFFHGDAVTADPTEAATAGVGWVFVDRPIDRPELSAALSAGGFVSRQLSDRAALWQVPGGCS